MNPEERQLEIVALARDRGRVSVSALAGRFAVTSETIRRDLDALADRGVLSRVHGGAVLAERLPLAEIGIHARETTAQAQKLSIARAAAALLPEGAASILLDAGTTTGRFAELLPSGRVRTVVTNSVTAAALLSARVGFEVELLGGRVRGLTQATVGPITLDILKSIRVDVAFMGANGMSVGHGFSTPDPSEAAVKRAMIATAHQVVVLADASKFDLDFLVSFAGIGDVHTLVTDSGISDAAADALRDRGIQLVVA